MFLRFLFENSSNPKPTQAKRKVNFDPNDQYIPPRSNDTHNDTRNEAPNGGRSRGQEDSHQGQDPRDSDEQNSNSGDPDPNSLAFKLFGNRKKDDSEFFWDPLVLESIKSTIHEGLSESDRTDLLTKFMPSDSFSFLHPPKLHKEEVPLLNKQILTRDSKMANNQIQEGVCLMALGSGISTLIQPEVADSFSDEVNAAISNMASAISLLADHFYLSSISRQAFIKPSYSYLGKQVADNRKPGGGFLFGENFIEDVKSAQSCNKISRELSKPIPFANNLNNPRPDNYQHPEKNNQQPQQRSQQNYPRQSRARIPVRNASASRNQGAQGVRQDRRRSRSRSRTRR